MPNERFTRIYLKGRGCSLADYGRRTPSEMIGQVRDMARSDLKRSQEILAAADDEFRVETYTGVHVRRNVEILQAGAAREGGHHD